MLIRLLRTYLPPYRTAIAVVVALQLVQTLATLYLPTLNADIIDNGVIKGDAGYILHVGAIMIGVTMVQIVCSVVAVYFGARTAMAVGRDVRSAIFHQVLGFSAREVGHFGTPSLITRTTNDVQQVPVSYTHLRAHETKANLVCRLLLEKLGRLRKSVCLLYTSDAADE